MSRYENPGIGNLILSLSRKMDAIQREIVGLRQEVKSLTFLVRQQSDPGVNPETEHSEHAASE